MNTCKKLENFSLSRAVLIIMNQFVLRFRDTPYNSFIFQVNSNYCVKFSLKINHFGRISQFTETKINDKVH